MSRDPQVPPPGALSAGAWGIYCYLVDNPGANLTIADLRDQFKEGKAAIANALNELIAAGYMRRSVVHVDGKIATRTELVVDP